MKNQIISSLSWALLERCSAQGIGLVINIILARLLAPDDYGILAIMVIFTNIANQIILNGFSTALIQNRDVTDEDYSSVFHVSMAITAVLYGILWWSAPHIAEFYGIPGLIRPFRILSLVLFPGTIQSIQTAKLKREMDFKTLFYLTLGASTAGGVTGIVMAAFGGGIWALVAQQMLGTIGSCLLIFIRFRWVPQCRINWRRVGVLISFGWKILVSNLLHTLYTNMAGLLIGKKYTTTTLAYYDKGQLLPNKLISNINDSIQSVMLSALARQQDDLQACKHMMRRSMRIASFILTPMLVGLAAISEPLVTILLTEKWLPCVPFMQVTCLAFVPLPIIKTNLEAIKAIGRSDVYLKLEILKKSICFLTLAVTVFCFQTPLAIVIGNAFTMYLEILIDAIPNQTLIGYSVREQIADLLPAWGLSALMFGVISFIPMLELSVWGEALAQIAAGVLVYAGAAAVLKVETFFYLWNMLRPLLRRLRK